MDKRQRKKRTAFILPWIIYDSNIIFAKNIRKFTSPLSLSKIKCKKGSISICFMKLSYNFMQVGMISSIRQNLSWEAWIKYCTWKQRFDICYIYATTQMYPYMIFKGLPYTLSTNSSKPSGGLLWKNLLKRDISLQNGCFPTNQMRSFEQQVRTNLAHGAAQQCFVNLNSEVLIHLGMHIINPSYPLENQLSAKRKPQLADLKTIEIELTNRHCESLNAAKLVTINSLW